MNHEGTVNMHGDLSLKVIRHLPEDIQDKTPRSLKDWVRQVLFGGAQKAVQFLPHDVRLELADHLNTLTYESSLSLQVYRADGSVEDYGVVSRKMVTADGVLWLASCMAAVASYDITAMKYHGIGVGTNAESATDTILQSELSTEYNPANTRGTGSSQSAAASGNNAIYTTVGLNVVQAPVAITEHGLFNRAATGPRVLPTNLLFDRSVFSVINLSSLDGIQSTYALTINSGS